MSSFFYSLNDALREGTPCALVLFGTLLRFYTPRHRIAVEERVKNRQLSVADARRIVVFLRWSAPMLVGLGFVLLAILVWGQLQSGAIS